MSEITNSIINLQPGIYILRHSKESVAPLSISRAPSPSPDRGIIEILATPNTKGSVLRDGSDCIVMHIIEAPVNILVTAYLANANETKPTLKIDRISLDSESVTATNTSVSKSEQIKISDKGLSIIGHIESKGDLLSDGGQCLGDPSSNLRLEGFQVMWPDRPKGIDISYNVTLEGMQPNPVVNSGQFCGTRQQALRIVEVIFQLTGPKAKQFELVGSAYFSGGFKLSIKSGMALSGPSGLEHLIALSLSVNKITASKKIKVL
jgi:hypothetical protein